MYVRTIKRKNKDGSVVEYVQPAHNVWDKDKGCARAEVIHSFGRSDQLDKVIYLVKMDVSCSMCADQDTV